MAQQSDSELMLCVKHGQLHQLGELFERHHLRLFRFFLNLCANRHWSEDMVQDTFSRMLRYSASYREDGSFIPWMFNIARNVSSDYFRSEIRNTGESGVDLDSFGLHESDSHSLQKDDQQQEYLQQLKEEQKQLQKNLLRLPLEQRTLILLAKIKQFNTTDLASIHGCSVGAIKVRLHRAMDKLRDYYQQDSCNVEVEGKNSPERTNSPEQNNSPEPLKTPGFKYCVGPKEGAV